MELQKQINALTSELNQYKDALKQVDAERVALDQMYVKSLTDAVSNKKELILINNTVAELNNKLFVSEKEKEALQARINELEKVDNVVPIEGIVEDVHCEAC